MLTGPEVPAVDILRLSVDLRGKDGSAPDRLEADAKAADASEQLDESELRRLVGFFCEGEEAKGTRRDE